MSSGGDDPDERAFQAMVASTSNLAATEGQSRLGQVRAVQAQLLKEKQALDVAVQAGTINGEEFARRVNELISSYLPRLGQVLGPEDTQRIFNANPGQTVQVLDPEMAARIDYTQGGSNLEPKKG